MPACPEAKITYQVTHARRGARRLRSSNSFLHSKFEWQITNFACAIGHAKRGDGKFRIALERLVIVDGPVPPGYP